MDRRRPPRLSPVPAGNESDAADTDKEFSINLAGGIMNATNIFSTFGFNEIKHLEIGGVCQIQTNGTCTPTQFDVVEPTSLALLGAGLLGLGLLRHRSRRDTFTPTNEALS